jgi:hypothetical protein
MREEKSNSRRGASTARRLDLKKTMKVQRFGRLQSFKSDTRDLEFDAFTDLQPVQFESEECNMIRALVMVLLCYGALEIVGFIIIIMIKFRSRNNRTSKSILDTLKTRKLRFRKINIKRVTVVKL